MRNRTKVITMVLCSIMFLGLTASYSLAKETCQDATITQVGLMSSNSTYSSSFQVYASCSEAAPMTFTDRIFWIAKGDQDKAMYAAALTAQATDKKVVLTISDSAAHSLIWKMLIK